MSTAVSASTLTGEEIVKLCRQHTIFEWSPQAKADPIPVARAEGVYFYTPEGKRYLDFNSQLMCSNVGHSHPKVVKAIQEQAAVLAYANPFLATEPRARLGAKLAEIAPGDIDTFFFTNGGAEANENAIRVARVATGRHKVLARYRSYHGGTAGAISLTGDPRRWAAEPGLPGIVRAPEFHKWARKEPEPVDSALRELEDVIRYEGAQNIAAFLMETVVGTNGLLIPPDGYLQGVREICDRHGILLIADEVMSGFGRTGKWFAVDHWGVVPDLMTMAKGLTSSYLPLGAVAMSPTIADFFNEKVLGDPADGGLKPRSDYTASSDDNTLVQGIEGQANSWGYFGFAYYQNNKQGLKDIKVAEKGTTGISPNTETITSGEYPLSRPLFIYVKNTSFKRPEVEAFMKYIIDNEEKVTGATGLISLTAEQEAKAKQELTDAVTAAGG